MDNILLSFAFAFMITFFAIPIIIEVARRKKLFDEPDERKVHKMVIPTLGGLGIFGGVFTLAGGEITLNAKTIPVFLGVVAIMVIFYRSLWCLGRGDTPGMKWTHLRLVNFDGQKPNRRQRFSRLCSGVLSLFAAGLGLLWALVDEETLTWHDHISKTFPTPY